MYVHFKIYFPQLLQEDLKPLAPSVSKESVSQKYLVNFSRSHWQYKSSLDKKLGQYLHASAFPHQVITILSLFSTLRVTVYFVSIVLFNRHSLINGKNLDNYQFFELFLQVLLKYITNIYTTLCHGQKVLTNTHRKKKCQPNNELWFCSHFYCQSQ